MKLGAGDLTSLLTGGARTGILDKCPGVGRLATG